MPLSAFNNSDEHPTTTHPYKKIFVSERLNNKRSLLKEINEMVKARGNGWGSYDRASKEWFDHYVDTIDAVTWTLNEIRKNDYV
jgi:hypothetical protein